MEFWNIKISHRLFSDGNLACENFCLFLWPSIKNIDDTDFSAWQYILHNFPKYSMAHCRWYKNKIAGHRSILKERGRDGMILKLAVGGEREVIILRQL